jgi:hypothetical protein
MPEEKSIPPSKTQKIPPSKIAQAAFLAEPKANKETQSKDKNKNISKNITKKKEALGSEHKKEPKAKKKPGYGKGIISWSDTTN